MATMKNRQIAFNVEPGRDDELHAWTYTLDNFSGTVKRLLREEMGRQGAKKAPVSAPVKVVGKGIKLSMKSGDSAQTSNDHHPSDPDHEKPPPTTKDSPAVSVAYPETTEENPGKDDQPETMEGMIKNSGLPFG